MPTIRVRTRVERAWLCQARSRVEGGTLFRPGPCRGRACPGRARVEGPLGPGPAVRRACPPCPCLSHATDVDTVDVGGGRVVTAHPSLYLCKTRFASRLQAACGRLQRARTVLRYTHRHAPCTHMARARARARARAPPPPCPGTPPCLGAKNPRFWCKIGYFGQNGQFGQNGHFGHFMLSRTGILAKMAKMAILCQNGHFGRNTRF